MNAVSLTAALKEESSRLGFDLVGATPAVEPPDLDRLRQWISDGCAGEMRYFADRLDAYRRPDRLLPGAKSVLMLGMNYRTVEPAASQDPERPSGRVSRYAWGLDYHDVIRPRLHRLADFHRQLVPSAQTRGVVDTAPLLERRFAQLAGLGWIGRNATLINERFGSWFFLAALLTTEELAYDEPTTVDHCRSCRACLDACPTGALCGAASCGAGCQPAVSSAAARQPPPRYRVDARKCLSYLTVESRGPLPAEFRAVAGNRLFGCDVCQEACPWNRSTPSTAEPAFQPAAGMNPVDLVELQSLDEAAFRRRFRNTPLWRPGREGILRNAEALRGGSHGDRLSPYGP
ncbi:MAG: DUF1730 domain-containing protein [Planctomycetaceae bacterium]|nr:DUF1730 domain-containing protein [Planctomycetaceae bacterium]